MRYILLTVLLFYWPGAVVSQQKEVPKIEETTAKEIEVYGKELEGKQRMITGKFVQVSNTWVELLLKDDSYVGFYVTDGKGALFQYSYAKKDKFGKLLLDLNRNDKLQISGRIQKVDICYSLMIEEIKKLP